MTETAGHPHFMLWQLCLKHVALKSQPHRIMCGDNVNTHSQGAGHHGGPWRLRRGSLREIGEGYLDLCVTFLNAPVKKKKIFVLVNHPLSRKQSDMKRVKMNQ